ncbi:MAG: Uma2 family endonuclease [Cyanobacteria bacterium J06588_5]
MVYQPLDTLPSTDELPCSDDTPVDNVGPWTSRSEDQNLLPNLLLLSLASLWSTRMDWFFAVDMAVYHTTGVSPKVPVVPDAFLSLGVERKKNGKSRKSYAVWEEGWTVPTVVLEMVSHRYNDEYGDKQAIYAKLGVLYYVVYNPEYWWRRHQKQQHQPFEVYKLENDTYHLQTGEPYWMAEVGIGIGRGRQVVGGIEQEVLLWYDQQGQAYPLSEQVIEEMQMRLEAAQRKLETTQQRAEAEQQRAEAERQRADRLADYLRSQGIDPDTIQ